MLLNKQNITAVIVEDEIACQEYLEKVLTVNFPAISLIGVVDNVQAGIALIKEHSPAIVFLDVNIKMGTGFDILRAIPNLTSEIIFTTAFDQYAIDAFKFHAIDYLLKPLSDELVISTLQHVLDQIHLKSTGTRIDLLLKDLTRSVNMVSKLPVGSVDGIEYINQNDIVYTEANGNYTKIVLSTGKTVTATRQLKLIEADLNKVIFFRVHNSFIVNCNYVIRYVNGKTGTVVLSNGYGKGVFSIPVSLARKDDFIRHIANI